MNEIILHHYPTSPFAEKIRVVLGIKGLAWHSVRIPVIMPKPDLLPLTGGYRKTPVMQIGADIYCDTQLIAREIERRYPTPSLYANSNAGIANALAFWSDRSLFAAAVGIAIAQRTDLAASKEFIEDRSKFSGREMNVERMRAARPMLLDQLRSQLCWYEESLADGRAFLLGSQPGLVDAAAYHPLWFITQSAPQTDAPFDELPRIRAWMQRMAALGHGKPARMEAQEALEIAKRAAPDAGQLLDAHDPFGRKPGDTVSVTPDDTGRDPVTGVLVSSSPQHITLRRTDPIVGEVNVHFPRAGFVVKSV